MPSFAKYRTVTDKMFPDLRDQAHLRAFLVIWGVARSSPPVGICLKALETFIVPHFTQDLLRKSASPRVINTSSVSQAARLPAQYEMTRVNYNAYKAYEQSKLFNRMITVGQVGSFFQQELLFCPARLFKSSRSRKKFQIRIRLDYFKHVKFLLLFKIPYYQSKRGNNQLLSLSTVVSVQLKQKRGKILIIYLCFSFLPGSGDQKQLIPSGSRKKLRIHHDPDLQHRILECRY